MNRNSVFDAPISDFPRSPYEYRCNISAGHYLKMIFLSVFLLPIRVVTVGLSFLATLCVANIIAADVSTLPNKPQNSLRWRIMSPVFRFFARMVYVFGGIPWIRFKGTRAPRSAAPILVLAPHTSYVDTLVAIALGLPSCVVSAPYARSSIGGVIKALQPILVDRDDPDSRKKTCDAICFRARSNENWPQLIIFPEGTCANGSSLIHFRPGAFLPGVPVQPILLRWPNRVNGTSWVYKGPSVWKLLWITLTQFVTRFEIEFLPVYVPSEAERDDPQLYANNVRRLMANSLGLPTCDLLYEDFCRLDAAKECKLPNPEAIVYLYALMKIIFDPRLADHNCAEWINTRLGQLLATARSSSLLSPAAFAEVVMPQRTLVQRETTLVTQAARYYSFDCHQNVDFSIFIAQVCMILTASDPLEGLRLAFKVFPTATQRFSESSEAFGTSIWSSAGGQRWPIDTLHAERLLTGLFGLGSDDELLQSMMRKSIGDAGAVEADKLFNVLKSDACDRLMSYSKFESKLEEILGRRGRPFLGFICDPDSTNRSPSVSMNLDESLSTGSILYDSVKDLATQSLIPTAAGPDEDSRVSCRHVLPKETYDCTKSI